VSLTALIKRMLGGRAAICRSVSRGLQIPIKPQNIQVRRCSWKTAQDKSGEPQTGPILFNILNRFLKHRSHVLVSSTDQGNELDSSERRYREGVDTRQSRAAIHTHVVLGIPCTTTRCVRRLLFVGRPNHCSRLPYARGRFRTSSTT